MARVEVVWVHPFWSKATDLNTDSNYAYLRRVLPALIEAKPDWLWVVSWPISSIGHGWTYRDDGLFALPRVVRAPWPYDSQMRTGVLAFEPRRFDWIDSRFAPTIYWLHQVESGSQVFGGYRQSFNAKARPIIVAQHHYIIHPSLPYSFEGLFPRLWQQIGGSLAADCVVLNSRHTAHMLDESFGEFLALEQMKTLHDKSVILPFGLIDDSYDFALMNGPVPPPYPVVVYNHRFEGYKNPDVTAGVLTGLRAEGLTFETWVTQAIDQRWKDFPVDRVAGHADQVRYLSSIAVPAINTLNSQHETFCISALDSIALGHVLVAPNGLTFPELVPDGYPFLFNNVGEQTDMLRHIMSTWPDEHVRWSSRLRAHARTKFALSQYAQSYAALLGGFDRLWTGGETKEHIAAAMGRFFDRLKPGTYALDQFVRALQKSTNTAEQSMPPRRVIREATAKGANVMVSSDDKGDSIALRWG